MTGGMKGKVADNGVGARFEADAECDGGRALLWGHVALNDKGQAAVVVSPLPFLVTGAAVACPHSDQVFISQEALQVACRRKTLQSAWTVAGCKTLRLKHVAE